ncbi:MAG TPA: glycosyltransferase family 4 protein [Usitatibacteraceae bacterium]|nr:glycosyltransferase family 4 protein [Usitatibacteraceae bacterium]
MSGVFVVFLPAIATIVVIALLYVSPLAFRIVDHPGDRSLHATPTPRIGGIGLMLGAMPVVFYFGAPDVRWIAGAAVVLAVVSFIDDVKSLPVAIRLPCHLAAAALAVGVTWPGVGIGSAASVAIAAAALLAIAWMTNLFNFMDGADGLAGGMALIGFGALAVAALRGGDAALAYAALALSASAAGFLVFNIPPARVFMGDAGSVPLGFLAGALGWLGAVRGVWPWWFPVLVFSPFIVDATVTLARRVAKGEPFLRAHRSHYYQRLVLGGWSHRRLAAAAWVLMTAVAASATVALGKHVAVQGAIISLWAIAYGALMLWMDRRQPPDTRR